MIKEEAWVMETTGNGVPPTSIVVWVNKKAPITSFTLHLMDEKITADFTEEELRAFARTKGRKMDKQ